MRSAVLRSAILWALVISPQVAAQDLDVSVVVAGLEHPWSLAWLPDGRLLVTERAGRLRIVADGRLDPDPVSGLPAPHVRAQAGLFEVLPAPDFADSGETYLSMADGSSGANRLRVIRARLEDGALEEVTDIFSASHPQDTSVHYGGRMLFLPDGTLLVTVGDGFDYREEAQSLASHWGTIVRLDRDGSAPADNPFVGVDDALPEIFTYGHRNIQGFVHDRESARLWSHEHGPRGGDELNLIEAGANYGWPAATHGVDYSGARITPFQELPGMRAPLRVWTPAIAPSGMALYDGDLFPEWQGDILMGGLVSRALHRLRVTDGEVVEEELLVGDMDRRIRDVRVGPDGAVYLLTDHSDGELLRIIPAQ